MDAQNRYNQASINTADNLRTIAQSVLARDLSHLTLPEVDQVVNAVAQIVPAGNIPGVILNGLARLPERRPPANILKRDVNLLFSGMEAFLDKAVYGAMFAGPAAVIWGYQHLLRLAGKEPEDAFPQGTWQFYVDYALRDDTARHANETHGFDTALRANNLHLTPTDRLAAWLMASIYTLHQYPALLANEWRERVYTYLLKEVTAGTPYAAAGAKANRDWEAQRPYGRGSDAGGFDYPAYRRVKFDAFINNIIRGLPEKLAAEWQRRVQRQDREALSAYQVQMSILAYLDPGSYSETHSAIRLGEARIGVIRRGVYYFVPACQPGTELPPDPAAVREQAAAIINATGDPAASVPGDSLQPLAAIRRTAQPALRSKLEKANRSGIDALRLCPILLDTGPLTATGLPLARVRQSERGVGDHPLTVHDTGKTFIFDQSHIFFDGAWGAVLAEIMTNEALSWAVYFQGQGEPKVTCAPRSFTPKFNDAERAVIQTAPRVTPEAAAESDGIHIKSILAMRKLFKRRNDLINLTVNDLLILYRAIHAATYWPSDGLVSALQALEHTGKAKEAGTTPLPVVAAKAALDAIVREPQANPAVLIPVDASQRSPRDRLYPMNVEVPLKELDLIALHHRTLEALEAYHNDQGGADERGQVYQSFDELQRLYLATLAGFGSVMDKAKEIALTGETASVGTIKMLAFMPAPLQRMLESIPSRFDMLNDLIKGREVFSNVGAVVPNSTLVRFITAKDDNEKKTLAWGVITDARNTMRITLRDFRPYVALLQSAGRMDLADRIAQEYLDAYVNGLNQFIRDLHRITIASRETRLVRLDS